MRRLPVVLVLLASPLAADGGPAVSGTVESADGRPLPAATAELVPLAPRFASYRLLLGQPGGTEPAASAVSDAAGRYTLAAPGDGMFKLVVRREGFVAMELLPLAVAGARDSLEMPPVALREGGTVRFQVAAAAGLPLAGAVVSAQPSQPSVWRELTGSGWQVVPSLGRTDAQGEVSLLLADGELADVTVVAPGGVAVRQRALRGGRISVPAAAPEGLAVEVREADGRPAPGVVVAGGDIAWPAGATDGAGRVRIPGAPSAPLELELLAADGRRQAERIAAGTRQARLVLRPAQRLRGDVVAAATSQPLAGALVWPEDDPGAAVRTDAAGRYELPWTDGGSQTVAAAAPGFTPVAVKLRPPSVAPGRRLRLALGAAATVAGRVADQDGRPVAGVSLDAVALPGMPRRLAVGPDAAESRAASDAAGRFAMAGLRPGVVYRLTARKRGYLPGGGEVGVDAAGPLHAEGLAVTLVRSRALQGRVTDPAGRPLADVAVELAAGEPAPGREEEEPAAARVRTAADGRFAIAEAPADRARLVLHRKGFVSRVLAGVRFPPGEGAVDLGALVLWPGAGIAGVVADPGGRPVAGAEVWVARPEKPEGAGPDAATGEDGRFRLADLPAGGAVELHVRHPDYLDAALAGVAVPSHAPLRVVLRPAGTVAGSVIDPEGAPVAGALVVLGPPALPAGVLEPVAAEGGELTATSAADGSFRVTVVPWNRCEIRVSADGFQPAPPRTLAVSGAGPDLEIRLARGSGLHGRVATSGGEALAGVRVMAGGSSTVTDQEGDYRLAGVAPGEQTVEALHPSLGRVERPVRIGDGDNRVDLRFPDGWRLTGRVVDEAGAPVAGARVSLTGEAPAAAGELAAVSRPAGRFSFSRVRPGRYVLSTEKSGYAAPEPAPVEVRDGAVDGVELVLPHSAAIVGQVHGLAADELAGVRVAAAGDGASREAEGVDWTGRFEIAGVAPGVWRVAATSGDGRRRAAARIEIPPGLREAAVDLEFRGGLALAGQVRLAGSPLNGATVRLTGGDGGGLDRNVTTGYDGAFRLADLDPGWYRLEVSHPGELITHGEDLHLTRDETVALDLATAEVSGRVETPEEQGVADAVVRLRQLVGAEEGALVTLGTDAHGLFHFTRLVEGRYRLSAAKPGYHGTEEDIDVRAGAGVQELRVVVSAAAAAVQ